MRTLKQGGRFIKKSCPNWMAFHPMKIHHFWKLCVYYNKKPNNDKPKETVRAA